MPPTRVLLILLFFLGPGIYAVKSNTSFPFTTMSPYTYFRQNFNIKGSVSAKSNLPPSDLIPEDKDNYELMKEKLEESALELCANSVMEFSWTVMFYDFHRHDIYFYGSGIAVCDMRLFEPDQTDCYCV